MTNCGGKEGRKEPHCSKSYGECKNILSCYLHYYDIVQIAVACTSSRLMICIALL